MGLASIETDCRHSVGAPRLARRGYWTLSLYPDAREAGGAWISQKPRGDEPAREAVAGRAAAEAARRARGKIRRYCAANRLNRLGTLTYRGEGCHDPAALRRDVAAFFKGLRGQLDGRALPYLWVPQWHPGGHGLHAHFAVGRFIRSGLIAKQWPHGFTHIKLLGDLPVGSGAIDEARVSARYLARYIGPSTDAGTAPGLHRYEVGQGFQPRKVSCEARSADGVLQLASELLGCAPSTVWRSDEEKAWDGPPAIWAQWAGR